MMKSQWKLLKSISRGYLQQRVSFECSSQSRRRRRFVRRRELSRSESSRYGFWRVKETWDFTTAYKFANGYMATYIWHLSWALGSDNCQWSPLWVWGYYLDSIVAVWPSDPVVHMACEIKLIPSSCLFRIQGNFLFVDELLSGHARGWGTNRVDEDVGHHVMGYERWFDVHSQSCILYLGARSKDVVGEAEETGLAVIDAQVSWGWTWKENTNNGITLLSRVTVQQGD